MRPSYCPESLPQPQSYRTQSLEHLGLVAGMFEELGIAEVIDQATQHDPEMRMVTRAWRSWGSGRQRYLLSLHVQVRIPALEDAR